MVSEGPNERVIRPRCEGPIRSTDVFCCNFHISRLVSSFLLLVPLLATTSVLRHFHHRLLIASFCRKLESNSLGGSDGSYSQCVSISYHLLIILPCSPPLSQHPPPTQHTLLLLLFPRKFPAGFYSVISSWLSHYSQSSFRCSRYLLCFPSVLGWSILSWRPPLGCSLPSRLPVFWLLTLHWEQGC